MRTRILITTAVALLVSFAFVLSGCQNGSPPNGKGGSQPAGSAGVKAPAPGAKFLGGQLVLESISVPASAGQPVTVVLKNVAGQALEGLTIQMIFLSPSTDGMSEFDSEKVIDEVNKLYKNESHTLSVNRGGRGKLLEVRLNVSSGETRFMPTTTREGGVPGSRLLGGLLEVVGVDNRLTFEPPSISFTVENVSNKVVEGFGFQVVLRQRNGKLVETRWQEVVESLPPGGKLTLSADLSGNDVGAAESVLKIRWEDI